ncbi:MAG: S26 family signal peptidase [Methanotrichaceae archaeon]|nr:S26 family signal peptidase [Methanotrichaceae archaeon]
MKIAEVEEKFNELPGFVRDIIFVVVVVGGVSLISQLALGLWTPMVAVESGSMVPNMNIGDIIIVQGASRTEIITWEEGELLGARQFNLPGDVILYRPYGKEKLTILDQLAHIFLRRPYPVDKATPIIHRALRRVEKGEAMWEGGPTAPFAGYITKGDHNNIIDQKAGMIVGRADETRPLSEQGSLMIVMENQTYIGEGISYLTPVRDEWVIGVARARIPYVGYIRLLPNLAIDWMKGLIWGS